MKRIAIALSSFLILVVSPAYAAVAGEFAVEGVIVERPGEAKQYGVCQKFTVTPKDAAFFFANAERLPTKMRILLLAPAKHMACSKRNVATLGGKSTLEALV